MLGARSVRGASGALEDAMTARAGTGSASPPGSRLLEVLDVASIRRATSIARCAYRRLCETRMRAHKSGSPSPRRRMGATAQEAAAPRPFAPLTTALILKTGTGRRRTRAESVQHAAPDCRGAGAAAHASARERTAAAAVGGTMPARAHFVGCQTRFFSACLARMEVARSARRSLPAAAAHGRWPVAPVPRQHAASTPRPQRTQEEAPKQSSENFCERHNAIRQGVRNKRARSPGF